MTKLPVSPELFQIVTDYSSALKAGKIDPKNPLKRTTPIIEFCQNFFLQFFENELGHEITGVGNDAKRLAVRLRLEAEKSERPEETRRLIAHFEELCDIWPDVLGVRYPGGSSATDFRNFHATYVVRLLDRACAWAKVRSYVALVERCESASQAYKAAVENI